MDHETGTTPGVRGRRVLLAGGTSAAGRTCARTLRRAGARVIVVGSDEGRLRDLAADVPGVDVERCDLTDPTAVEALRDRVHETDGPVDGLLHLVGGWRGGGGLAGQSDEDLSFLLRSFTALRNVSRTFDDDLGASDAGRLAIVSSTAVARPLAGGANYAAVKAASEAWTRAVAQGFAKQARDTERELRAAAVVFRAKTLAGAEQVLADAFLALWDAPATAVNDRVVEVVARG
ncbi:SDR family oxidoreductase [uncultured Microbacterium sp.]|uniref:SDR family NAD(P)-dependent oxidoreductase n=1 Tax=uncultured Microbacterium sp. TaxID=191216 RepID=UPI0025CBB3F4|nr:SDR family oxidoreductase [uncultured Microbacterium sp.]